MGWRDWHKQKAGGTGGSRKSKEMSEGACGGQSRGLIRKDWRTRGTAHLHLGGKQELVQDLENGDDVI